MCGITGFWQKNPTYTQEKMESLAHAMGNMMAHRGPDGEGVWIDPEHKLAFCHRRLAILDLSEAGFQPMHSASGRYTIIFNGEVYNAPSLAKELKERGFSFKGHSDTEVMLAAIEAWGLEVAISRFIGMFAFALYDHKEKRLSLVRDRLGVKPLYFSVQGNILFFGSQVKSFTPHPAFQRQVNRGVLSEYLLYNVVPASLSIFQGVEQVQPGEIVSFNGDLECARRTYWSLLETYHKGRSAPIIHEEEVLEHARVLLKDAVKLRMLSDVPLGAFLSGGIDSSLIVALMQTQSSQKVKTYTIGFHEQGFDEAVYAKEVAKHLGTDHHELYLSSCEALDVIPKLVDFYDEPFADSSQIPTYLVSHFARQHVTVALSGDGGDEFFGGYTRYHMTKKLMMFLNKIPFSWHKPLGKILGNLSHPGLMEKLSFLSSQSHLFDKVHKLSRLMKMGVRGPFDVYHRLLCSWYAEEVQRATGIAPTSSGRYKNVFKEVPSLLNAMQLCDSMGYLPDDILTKVDRASMAVSLEAREPLLDHRIAEFSFSLPDTMKVRQGKGKWLLRQILKKYVPEHLFERPKQGFGIPLHQWLRKELRPWAEDLLAPSLLKKHGFEDITLIQKYWEEHKAGKRNWQANLWAILMYQAWAEKWSA